MTKKHGPSKAQEAKGGRRANKVLVGERRAAEPPLSESYVGASHHTMGARKHKGGKKK